MFVKINSDYQEPLQIRATGNILFVVGVALKLDCAVLVELPLQAAEPNSY